MTNSDPITYRLSADDADYVKSLISDRKKHQDKKGRLFTGAHLLTLFSSVADGDAACIITNQEAE